MWQTQTAVVTGRGHLRRGLPCQDRTWVLEENGVTAMALADGAGSTRYGQEGADVAVREACRILCGDFDSMAAAATPLEMRLALLEPVVRKITLRAEELHTELQQLSCTLLAAAVRGNQYLLFHVGDGVIGYQRNGRLRVASVPENSEFCNTTTFVTSRNALRCAKVNRGCAADLEAFVLMSDGCEASLYAKERKQLAPLVGKLLLRKEVLHPQVSQEQLARVMETMVAGRTQDDCSIALLSRKGELFGQWNRMTQREKASVLGIATENRNHRRHQIGRYAEAYGVSRIL